VAQILVLLRSPIIGVVALVLNSWLVNAQGPPRRILLLYPYDNVNPATLTAGTAIRKRLPSPLLMVASFPSRPVNPMDRCFSLINRPISQVHA
jgi:hypothetical protein